MSIWLSKMWILFCPRFFSGSCEDGDVNLGSDGIPYVFWSGDWSPICGHWFWNDQNGAKSFCQKLGFADGSFNKENSEYCEDAIEIGTCRPGEMISSCTGGSNKYKKTEWCQAGGDNAVKITISCIGNTQDSAQSSCEGKMRLCFEKRLWIEFYLNF